MTAIIYLDNEPFYFKYLKLSDDYIKNINNGKADFIILERIHFKIHKIIKNIIKNETEIHVQMIDKIESFDISHYYKKRPAG